MKLNPDCIRDILFVVEELATYTSSLGHEPILQKLAEKYSVEEICYHVRQADHSGLFLKVTYYKGGFIIKDLSPQGHQLIQAIREDTNWSKTKEIAKAAGSFSIEVLKAISSQVITNLISSQFGK